MAVAVDLGGAGMAIDLAGRIDRAALPRGRQARLLADLARAHTQRRQVEAATEALLEADVLAPALVAFDAGVREAVRHLVALAGDDAGEGLGALAHRTAAFHPDARGPAGRLRRQAEGGPAVEVDVVLQDDHHVRAAARPVVAVGVGPVGPERRRRPRPHHVDLAFDLERELALDDVHHLEGALEVALVAALLVAEYISHRHSSTTSRSSVSSLATPPRCRSTAWCRSPAGTTWTDAGSSVSIRW